LAITSSPQAASITNSLASVAIAIAIGRHPCTAATTHPPKVGKFKVGNILSDVCRSSKTGFDF
jgi:hypothetical protein